MRKSETETAHREAPDQNASQTPRGQWVYRHALPVRIFHWINAVCFVVLLMSGMQIFNAYPRLHWGNTGYFDTPAIFEITGARDVQNQKSWISINGEPVLDTTGFLGVAHEVPLLGTLNQAFPNWMTLPSTTGDLHNGRGWHFFALYIFAFNLIAYLIYGFATGRFRRALTPSSDQLAPKEILQDLWRHLRLKRARGQEALRYNLLQKLSYIVVLFVLLPTMVLSGMTMSPSFLAAFPWLIDLFQGRQSARTIHFICAFSLLAFVFVHLFQVFVAGFVNEVRSMITGWFRAPEEN